MGIIWYPKLHVKYQWLLLICFNNHRRKSKCIFDSVSLVTFVSNSMITLQSLCVSKVRTLYPGRLLRWHSGNTGEVVARVVYLSPSLPCSPGILCRSLTSFLWLSSIKAQSRCLCRWATWREKKYVTPLSHQWLIYATDYLPSSSWERICVFLVQYARDILIQLCCNLDRTHK